MSRERLIAGSLTLTLALGVLAVQSAAASPPGNRAADNRAPDAPTSLRVDDLTRPLNLDRAPRFGWYPQDKDPGEVQTAYQVRVTEDDGDVVWDSGKVDSDEQSYAAYDGPALTSASTFDWTVRTWDREGATSPWARPASFDTGLRGDWDGASWIRRTSTEADDYTLARTQVRIGDSKVVRARTYTAANHTYELYLDGRRVDRGTSFGYPGEDYYQAADVTRWVKPGRDLAIGARVHWYGSGQGRPAGLRGLLTKLVVEHADGSVETFVSDGSWRVARDAQFLDAGRRNGEGDRVDSQDATRAIAGWDRVGFDDTAWAPAVVAEAYGGAGYGTLTGQDTRVSEEVVHPERLLTADDGTVVADFGVVVPARPRVHFDEGVAGRAVPLRASYELDETGRASTADLATQDTNMDFPYVQADGAQDYQAFTHLGFRYLEIPSAGEEIALDDVSAVVVHTDVDPKEAARFDSSDAMLDEVWAMMQRSSIYSIQEAFVDTPTREKGQFLGDAVNISYATMQDWRERSATRQAISEFIGSQARYWNSGDRLGRYNAVYPNGDGRRDIPDYTEMFVDWVWRYYEVTGDAAFVAGTYPSVRATADYVLRHIPASGPTAGLVTNLSGGSGAYLYGIVDWPAPGRFGYDMTAAARTTVNAQAVEVLRRASDVATLAGAPAAEVAGYAAAADALAARMNETLRRSDGVYVDGLLADGTQSTHAGQHSTSYAIAYDVAPEVDYPALATYLASLGMKQGPMTAHWLLQALSDADRPADVLSLLTNTNDLGWADIVSRGGSFTWEAWALDPGSNYSQSHGWGAQAAVDVMETMLGIRVTAPGASSIEIVPPASGLASASGTEHTQRGPVRLQWTRAGEGVNAGVTIPVNMTATVRLPAGASTSYRVVVGDATYVGTEDGRAVYEVGSGTTRFAPQG